MSGQGKRVARAAMPGWRQKACCTRVLDVAPAAHKQNGLRRLGRRAPVRRVVAPWLGQTANAGKAHRVDAVGRLHSVVADFADVDGHDAGQVGGRFGRTVTGWPQWVAQAATSTTRRWRGGRAIGSGVNACAESSGWQGPAPAPPAPPPAKATSTGMSPGGVRRWHPRSSSRPRQSTALGPPTRTPMRVCLAGWRGRPAPCDPALARGVRGA